MKMMNIILYMDEDKQRKRPTLEIIQKQNDEKFPL